MSHIRSRKAGGLGTLLLAAACLLRAQTGTTPMEVLVRSGIDQTEKAKRDHDPAYGNDRSRHACLYVLAKVKEVKAEEKLVARVDERALARDVKQALAKQGFVEVKPGEKPQIVIMVNYGRGYLPNPYVIDDRQRLRNTEVTNLSNSDHAGSPTFTSFHRLSEKATLADLEKLIIQVIAYKYPPPADPKAPLVMAWRTTMDTDDPDHRDLNLAYPKMLEAGAPYFDRHINLLEDVKVDTTMPEGRVDIGTPEVVKSGSSEK